METATHQPAPTYVALMALERAIKSLWHPCATTTTFDGPLTTQVNHFPTGPERTERRGEPPRLWPEVQAVTEDLLGASFVVAQSFLLRRPRAELNNRQRNVVHIANYWKHRSEWGNAWDERGNAQTTIQAIRALGESPPVALGQMDRLVQKVLACPYSAERLWLLIV